MLRAIAAEVLAEELVAWWTLSAQEWETRRRVWSSEWDGRRRELLVAALQRHMKRGRYNVIHVYERGHEFWMDLNAGYDFTALDAAWFLYRDPVFGWRKCRKDDERHVRPVSVDPDDAWEGKIGALGLFDVPLDPDANNLMAQIAAPILVFRGLRTVYDASQEHEAFMARAALDAAREEVYRALGRCEAVKRELMAAAWHPSRAFTAWALVE